MLNVLLVLVIVEHMFRKIDGFIKKRHFLNVANHKTA